MIPFCIWSLFYTTISLIKTIYAGESIVWNEVIYTFFVGKSSAPFYYIAVLFQLTLLTPILVRIIKKHRILNNLLWFVTPLYLIYVYGFNICQGSPPELYGTLFPAWFIFYYMGLHIKMTNVDAIITKMGKQCFVMGALALSIIEAFVLLVFGCDVSFAYSQIKLSSFLYAAMIVLWLLKNEKILLNRVNCILKSVGDYSYGIFYVHCFILSIVKRCVYYTGISSVWVIYYVVSWATTVVISFSIVRVTNLLLSRSTCGNRIVRLIGFQ